MSFGERLRQERRRRHLSQEALAGTLGFSPRSLSRWEQGQALPQGYSRLQLSRFFGLSPEELFAGAGDETFPFLWSVPHLRNPFFTGREEILQALHTRLSINQAPALTQAYALQGLGGIGKTQLALEYAYRHAQAYRAVFWIEAEATEHVLSSMLRIAELLPLPHRDEKDHLRIERAVQRWLSLHEGWLLIWDNLEDLDLLHSFLPPGRQGTILITTRCQALGTLARGIDLAPMGREEALLFVLRRARILESEASQEHVQQLAISRPGEYIAASELVEAMGGLPLALDQAGAYIEETGCSLEDYLHRYEPQRLQLLDRRGASKGNHPASVAATFRLSSQRLEREQPAATDLLRVCALLHAEAIPEEVFGVGATHLGPRLATLAADPAHFDQALAALRHLSLVHRQAEMHTLSIHRLVQAVLLDAMTETERKLWSWRSLAALDAVFPEVQSATAYAVWRQCERLLPHALPILQRASAVSESLPLASLAYKTACYLLRRGWYAQAEPLFQRALQIREQALGPQHPKVADSLNSLAILSLNQSKYAQAKALFQRALQIREQALGPQHPKVADSLNSLAVLSCKQGEYTQAEPLFQRALQIYEQALGPQHPKVAISLNNLAELYWEQGEYARAEPLSQQALRIREQTLGPQHPDLADSFNMLATLSREQRKYAQAERLYQRALQIREQILGPQHPNVATTLTNLAECYHMQGKYAQAERLYQRALQIIEQSYGVEHPDRAYLLNSLANLFREQERYAEAESSFRQALRLREQHLGKLHPETAQTLHDLALFYQKQGHLSEALSLAERALNIRMQSLGYTHPATAATFVLYGTISTCVKEELPKDAVGADAPGKGEGALSVNVMT